MFIHLAYNISLKRQWAKTVEQLLMSFFFPEQNVSNEKNLKNIARTVRRYYNLVYNKKII